MLLIILHKFIVLSRVFNCHVGGSISAREGKQGVISYFPDFFQHIQIKGLNKSGIFVKICYRVQILKPFGIQNGIM